MGREIVKKKKKKVIVKKVIVQGLCLCGLNSKHAFCCLHLIPHVETEAPNYAIICTIKKSLRMPWAKQPRVMFVMFIRAGSIHFQSISRRNSWSRQKMQCRRVSVTGHVVTCMHDIKRELKYTTNIVHFKEMLSFNWKYLFCVENYCNVFDKLKK